MAKKEKVIVKGFGLISFLLAILMFALAVYGNNILTFSDGKLETLDANNIFGVSMELVASEGYLETVFNSESVEMKLIFGVMFIFVEALISIIVLIKLIVMFFGIFGFIGKKDAKVVAKKLSKYTKNALGAVAIQIFGMLLYSADDGIIPEEFNSFTLLAGIAFAVMYILVRLYRWFIASKRPILDCVFDVLKDGIYIAALIILFSFVDVAFLSEFTKIQSYFNVELVDGVMSDAMVSTITGICVSIFQFFIITSLMRKTLRLLPFNNYKSSAYGKLRFGYVSYFIITTIMCALSLCIGDLIAGSFDTANIVSLILDVVVMVLPQLLAMVAVLVAALVEEETPVFAYPLSKVPVAQVEAQAEEQGDVVSETKESDIE